MHVHVRVQRWVVWWFYVGVVCGAVAIANILGQDLSRMQERTILLIGVLHWVLGGLVCYALDGIRVEGPSQRPKNEQQADRDVAREWHPASDFLLPGSRKTVLPPRR